MSALAKLLTLETRLVFRSLLHVLLRCRNPPVRYVIAECERKRFVLPDIIEAKTIVGMNSVWARITKAAAEKSAFYAVLFFFFFNL